MNRDDDIIPLLVFDNTRVTRRGARSVADFSVYDYANRGKTTRTRNILVEWFDRDWNCVRIVFTDGYIVHVKTSRQLKAGTQKRFVKLLMGCGIQRNMANAIAQFYRLACARGWKLGSYTDYLGELFNEMIYIPGGAKVWKLVKLKDIGISGEEDGNGQSGSNE